MSVFVDTSGFYAVLDADDDMHEAASKAWIDMLERGVTLHSTNYILVETIALLQNRIGMEAVRVFAADVLPVVKVFWVEEIVHSMAHHTMLVAARRGLSLVDCVSFEAMRRLHLTEAFCFDPHFLEQGFELVPEPEA